MTTTEPATVDETTFAGCPTIEGYDKKFCTLATETSLARLAQLQEAGAEARAALAEAEKDNPNHSLVAAMLRTVARICEKDPAPEVVPYDDLLLAVLRELEVMVSAEPSALLEQAIAAVRGLSGGGWIVVRQEDIP